MTARRLILGTAGHVDHGKTQLVSFLTGWETDRLKEEKERGISIELGFAPLRLDDDTTLGIVDVPGHEKFVKNMVAGAGGIDLAMLVIAADESVMPQTREHLEVLKSLAITSGVVVISKTDLATEDMLEIVHDEIADLVRGTFLEGAPVVETSAKTGHGTENLKQTLRDLAGRSRERDSSGPFRLAVDRVFHRQGIGAVVTGSCYSGTVSIGDSLELLPTHKGVRVRGLQSFGEKRQQGYAGERLAIALQGAKLSEIARGDMLVTKSKFAVSFMFDARLRVAEYTQFEIKQRERLRVHHGAREVFGRITILEGDELRSGANALVQIRLESPIVGAEGDYFVVRKYSPSIVLGGGRIIDARPSKHRRYDPVVIEELQVQEHGDPRDILLQAVKAAGLRGVASGDYPADDILGLVEDGRVANIDGVLFCTGVLDELAEEVAALASTYVDAHPLRYGIDKEEVRQRVRFPHSTALFNGVLSEISAKKPIFIKNNLVRVGTEELELSSEAAEETRRLEFLIKKPGLQFDKLGAIQKEWRGKGDFADALQLLRDAGAVIRIGEDVYIHRDALNRCLSELSHWFETSSELGVADFKDLFGISRKHAIPLLEYFDNNRITARDGNVRRRGPRLQQAAGDPGS